MSKRITFSLSQKSIQQAQKELKAYIDSLPAKCEQFVTRLAEIGISAARENVSAEYGSHILFHSEVDNPTKYGCKGLMIATQTGLVRRQWRSINNASGVETVDVSPLLMAEFGSGARASDAASLDNAKWASKAGAGQGTFPGQEHAFDEDGWYWMDLEGEWHHSMGEAPTMPMYNAFNAMYEAIASTAKEVFGS